MVNTRTPLRQHGFTIVELLVVIVVIAILAAITIVAYNGVQQRARVATVQSDLEGAAKQLAMDQVINSAYPATVALANNGAGLKASPGTTYQYAVNNTTNPQTYCITATNSTTSYFVSSSNNVSTSGGCPGHGVGGSGARTNLATNPSFEVNLTGWVSAGTNTRDTSVYSTGAASAKVLNNAGGGYLYADIPSVPGDVWTLSVDVRTVGTNGAPWVIGFQTASGEHFVAIPATQTAFTRLSVTTPPQPAGTTSVRVFPAWNLWVDVGGDGVYVDAILLEKSTTTGSYADGNSLNWVWNSAPNNSTSTGP